MIQIAAVLYAIAIALVIVFQCCLIAGAPWGKLTQGGKHKGKLPVSGRMFALLSIALLLYMAGVILSAAQLPPGWFSLPRWVGWVVLVIHLISVVLNIITPSTLERRLWAPVTIVLLGLASYVIIN